MWRRGHVCLTKRICLLCAALWWAASSPASPAEGCWGARVKPRHATPGQTRRFFQRRSLLFQRRQQFLCAREINFLFQYHFGSEWRMDGENGTLAVAGCCHASYTRVYAACGARSQQHLSLSKTKCHNIIKVLVCLWMWWVPRRGVCFSNILF